MPAEWEKHESLWLAWPHDDKTTFPVNFKNVISSFVAMVKAVHKDEPVNLIVLDEDMKNLAISILNKSDIDMKQIRFFIANYADVWIRDYAPLFVKNVSTGEPTMAKWIYNAYGNKFEELLIDNEVFKSLKNKIGKPMVEPGIVMEGGALEINGKGTLVTTEQCLLNPNRNPQLNSVEIENYLKNYIGVSNIIWLKEGIINDHTDGHVDDIVKFVNENTILCAYESDISDPNFEILNNNFKLLEQSVDQDGKPFNLVKVPMPHIVYNTGEKAPASYINFYIGNSVVLVPIFNDSNDAKALDIIQSFFKDRKVVGIDCSDIVYGGGTIHCMTQQQPEF